MFFGKKKVFCREPDKIWQTKAAKQRGVSKEIQRLMLEGFRVLLITHFRKTEEEIAAAIKDLHADRLTSSLQVESWCQAGLGSLAMTSSEELTGMSAMQHSDEMRFCVIGAEHYPLYDRDKALIEWAGSFAERICFFDSLEMPFLKPFGMDNLKLLMEKLGASADEFISHSFIDSAIENAQKKLVQKVNGDLPARSPEEWMASNYSA
jgi:hypothetical protein